MEIPPLALAWEPGKMPWCARGYSRSRLRDGSLVVLGEVTYRYATKDARATHLNAEAAALGITR